MSKIAVWVCSNSALDYADYPQDIQILRSMITFGDGIAHEDYVDMDTDSFYQRIAANPEDIPKTSYVSPGKVDRLLAEHLAHGYTDVIVITISSNLSGLYNFFQQLAEDDSHPQINIHPFDSKTLVYAEAFMALTAHKMAEQNNSVIDILAVLDTIRKQNHVYFAVDTLKYLVLNGRLSKSSALIGNFLKVRPLLQLNHEGRVVPLEKARTTKGAIQRMLEYYFNETADKNILTYISHANNLSEAQRIKAVVLAACPNREIVISHLTPVVGAHAGPKAIAIGYIDLTNLEH